MQTDKIKTPSRFRNRRKPVPFHQSQATDPEAGFTLLELLVVISIIGFLASIIASVGVTARVKARDAKRKQDAAQIANALALYYDDHQSSYPPGGTQVTINGGDWDPIFKQVMSPYINSMPIDPLANNLSRYYSILNWAALGFGSNACVGHKVVLVFMEDPTDLGPNDDTCGYNRAWGWYFVNLGPI